MKNLEKFIISLIFIFCFVFSFADERSYCGIETPCTGEPKIDCMGHYCISEAMSYVACYIYYWDPPSTDGDWIIKVCSGTNASEVLDSLPDHP